MKIYATREKNTYEITGLVQSVSWGGSISQAARKLTLKMLRSSDYYTSKFVLNNGDIVTVYDDEERLLFLGTVFSKETDRSGGSISITVYDPLVYLTKNVTTKVVTNTAIDKFIKSLCSEFGIELIRIPKISTSVKEIYRDMSLYEIISKALEVHSKLTGVAYVLRAEGNKFAIDEIGTNSRLVEVEIGKNVMNITESESIEELRNRIVIRGKGDNVLYSASDYASMKKYGSMQHQQTEDGMNQSQARVYAEKLLLEKNQEEVQISVQTVGNCEVRAGDKIKLVDAFLNLEGEFFIEEDSHEYSPESYTMNLKLRNGGAGWQAKS